MNGRGYFPLYMKEATYIQEASPEEERRRKHYGLKFPEAADCLRVKLNGEDVGYLACFPAKVEVTDALWTVKIILK